ncbi:MAG: long-chain-fatty-acid--CoA ligase [Elusimicrobia bacterium]|nr:long-chain-fatty-acid--CoA ligase [Elusimicrobiota bacterium]
MTLTDLLETRAKENHNTVAYVFKDSKITFKQLNADVDSVAAALSRLGVKEGDRFAICIRNAPAFIITWFALAKLGAIAVHINFMVNEEELAYILKDSGSKGIISQKEFLGKVRQAAAQSGTGLLVLTDEEPKNKNEYRYEELKSKYAGQPYPKFAAEENTTVTILYTSGTTGKPKGAMLSHHNLYSNAVTSIQYLGLVSRKERILCILPMFHIFAWASIVLVGMAAPCLILIVESITPPDLWLKLMAKWKVTLFPAVPPLYHALSTKAKGIKRLVLRYWFFRTVKRAISGAAPLPLEVLKTFEKKFGVPILEGYGLTETSPAVSVNTLAYRKAGSVGKVIPGVKVKILDDNATELPQGGEGEICVKGANVFQGYWRLPEATRECFTSDGYFRTGDIGRFDEEGYLTICDRKKDMIIVKGLKVFPVQIEEMIMRHPNVQEAAVLGVPQEDGDEIIQAYVTPKKGTEVKKEEVQDILASLPAYKRPRDIEFRDELPKNALQKILKRELRREAQEKLKARRMAAKV